MTRLQRDLPTYIDAANGVSIDNGDECDFTKEILSWRKRYASKFGAWPVSSSLWRQIRREPSASFGCSRSCSKATKTPPFPTILAGPPFFATKSHSVLIELANRATKYTKKLAAFRTLSNCHDSVRGDMKQRLPTKTVRGRTAPVCSAELSGRASS